MKRCWLTDELVEHWSLSPEEIALLHNKTEHNRLGFALLLKFIQIEGRFPNYRLELPDVAIDPVAREVEVAPERIFLYDWKGRSIEYHRAQIRSHLGFRTASVQDAQELTEWLCTQPEASDASVDHLKAIILQRCRALHIEPPAADRVDRLVRSAMRTVQDTLCETIYRKLPPDVIQQMDALLETTEEPAEGEAQKLSLYTLKTDPGRVGLESILAEIAKLQAIRRMGLPTDLFRGVSPKLILRLRQRAAAEPPRELRAHPAPIRCTLMGALCWMRAQEITDNLVELLIQVIHKISVRAEQKVEQDLLDNFRKVTAKTSFCFRSPRSRWSVPTTACATWSIRWQARRPCRTWCASTKRRDFPTALRCIRSCAPPTRATIGAWYPGCWRSWSSDPTMPPTSPSSVPLSC